MHPTLKTVIGGELVELPGTIAAIRAQLPDDQVLLVRRAVPDGDLV